jgi:methionine-rich copper-binding protein CopC
VTASARQRAVACGALAGLLALAAPAEPHAVLVRSVPASRATVRQPPRQVELWFSERLEPAFSTASVWSAAGVRVDAANASVASEDPKRLSITLSPVAPGRYTVRYRVVSVDSHVAEGRFSFTVGGSAG